MSSKIPAWLGGVLLLAAATSTGATPWLAPGDLRARFAVQKLADRGHLALPATSWPIMWRNLDASAGADQAASGSAAAYLRFEREQQFTSGSHNEFFLSAQTQEPAITGFSGYSVGDAAAGVDLQWQGTALAAGLSVTYAANPDDSESVRLDGSYIAATASNWIAGAGAIERWWGPGWQSSLILSNNARPMPSVWLSRNAATAPDNAWFGWLGPWDIILLAGQYESERAIPDTRLLAMRFAFRPVSGLDIGLSRAIMFGGEGRPEDLSTIWHALTGTDNGQLEEDDPGNQIASIDVRWGFAVGQQSMGLYSQMMGEDESGAFPSRKSWLLGLDWTSQWLGADQQWFLEYVNTTADDLFGDARYNVTYDHSRYQTGYRYYGRSMGASFDGDAEALTLGAYHFLADGSNLWGKVTHARLNRDGATRAETTDPDVFYTVPAENTDVNLLELGYGRLLFSGWLELSAQIADDEVEYLGGVQERWSVASRWTYRF